MERKNKIILAGCIVFILGVIGCILWLNIANSKDDAGKRLEGAAGNTGSTMLGEFEAEDLEGNAVDESIFGEAEMTMVNVWGTFCNPCIKEMPALAELSDEYQEKGVQIVGICIDTLLPDGSIDNEAVASAKEISERTGADYLHIIPDKELYRTISSQVSGVPTTFFLDKNGKLLGSPLVGARGKEDWAEVIDSYLERVKEQNADNK